MEYGTRRGQTYLGISRHKGHGHEQKRSELHFVDTVRAVDAVVPNRLTQAKIPVQQGAFGSGLLRTRGSAFGSPTAIRASMGRLRELLGRESVWEKSKRNLVYLDRVLLRLIYPRWGAMTCRGPGAARGPVHATVG